MELSAREEWVKDLINRSGDAFGASRSQKRLAYDIIKCENTGLEPSLQSYHKRPDGSREQSYGLGQFYIPAKNKTVDGEVFTVELAKNPTTSVATVVKYITEGKASLWSCYNYVK